jgi:hypothetical protein
MLLTAVKKAMVDVNQSDLLSQMKGLEGDKEKIKSKRLILGQIAEIKANSQRLLLGKWHRMSGSAAEAEISGLDEIRAMIETREARLHGLEEADKKRANSECKLDNAPNEWGILGKTCHLAVLESPSEAFVLSWHMQGDMDVIVTYGSDKARELYRRFGENQQVIALEGIYRGNLSLGPLWDEGALPYQHLRSVRGNPVYARTLLKFTKDPESCKIIFGSLLGDTLIIDTLDQAIDYRNQLAQKQSCPTILTRDGRRLMKNGRVDSMSSNPNLHIGFFGLAPNPEIAVINTEINVLKAFYSATVDRVKAEQEMVKYQLEMTPILDQLNDKIGQLTQHLHALDQG